MRRKIIGAAFVLVLALVVTACREPNAPRSSTAVQATTPEATTGGAKIANEQDSMQPLQDAIEYEATSLCNIEAIGGMEFGGAPIPVELPAIVQGWLAGERGQAMDAPTLVLEDKRNGIHNVYSLVVYQQRPDVVQAFPGSTGLDTSGFEVMLPDDVPIGSVYHLYLTHRIGERRFLCDNGREIKPMDTGVESRADDLK